jgi:hypothetical protein
MQRKYFILQLFITLFFRFFKQMVREEGLTAMYKGLLPNLIGVAPSK